LSFYLARVADRVTPPRADAHDAAVTAESRLEELKAVLTQIDAFGVQGAESVDEAQVRVAGAYTHLRTLQNINCHAATS